jgi:hypothetical protein
VAVPTAKATAPSGLMRAAKATTVPAAAMPAAETTTVPAAAMPAAETTTVPAAEATIVPGTGPVGARYLPAVEAPRHSSESGPDVAEMSDCCARSNACEPAKHVSAIPPSRPDGAEGKDGRSDKEREGGWREDD